MSDGRRLATLRGDTAKGGFWNAILHSSEVIWASSAPLAGALLFSPDSKYLFASSRHIYQWDVSGLN